MTDQLVADIHPSLDEFTMPLIRDVWAKKYKWGDEQSMFDTINRVVDGVYAKDGSGEAQQQMRYFMLAGLWMPAGRILAGAGTSKKVTLMNCYVNGTVPDSMEGIHTAIGNVMFTLQQGGGIGTDFSTLRPAGAALKRTGKGSAASGPIPFMTQWDATSKTVKSAGDRRGAMMATMSDWHPDLPAFIQCKRERGVMEQFNISVLVSDAFMEAVEADAMWSLHFPAEPAEERASELVEQDFEKDGVTYYVYSVWKARDLWNMIMENTYDYAEPGVIFIDRVNDLNNLQYCETIRCTNPCGEQPLPPHGACDLGAVNLSRLVDDPFTSNADVNWDMLSRVVAAGVRFLDNVIDVTQYPLEEQAQEQYDKRRVGLGISGLADALAQMKLVYGSNEAVAMTDKIMKAIAEAAYEASAMLAQERGAFPLFDADKINRHFLEQLDPRITDMVNDLGLRNGVLLTIAPTGTTSLVYGNISSGLEPNFAHSYNRKVFSSNNEHQAETYEEVKTYLYSLHQRHGDGYKNPEKLLDLDYMITAQELPVDAHLRMQGACQKWVDASISKTINLPEDITFGDFQAVYLRAYALGCKGCTTYRPSDVRGSVLSLASDKPEEVKEGRPEALPGLTYKIKWPSWNASIFLTINHYTDNTPWEIFIQSKDARHQEWVTALTVMISALMRSGMDVQFIVKELQAIKSTHDGAFLEGKYYGSLLARIGEVLERHFQSEGVIAVEPSTEPVEVNTKVEIRGDVCPECEAPSMVMAEGCMKCTNCGYSKCG